MKLACSLATVMRIPYFVNHPHRRRLRAYRGVIMFVLAVLALAVWMHDSKIR
jgi:hypothetical protein